MLLRGLTRECPPESFSPRSRLKDRSLYITMTVQTDFACYLTARIRGCRSIHMQRERRCRKCIRLLLAGLVHLVVEQRSACPLTVYAHEVPGGAVFSRLVTASEIR